jgi:hypothetical protein
MLIVIGLVAQAFDLATAAVMAGAPFLRALCEGAGTTDTDLAQRSAGGTTIARTMYSMQTIDPLQQILTRPHPLWPFVRCSCPDSS